MIYFIRLMLPRTYANPPPPPPTRLHYRHSIASSSTVLLLLQSCEFCVSSVIGSRTSPLLLFFLSFCIHTPAMHAPDDIALPVYGARAVSPKKKRSKKEKPPAEPLSVEDVAKINRAIGSLFAMPNAIKQWNRIKSTVTGLVTLNCVISFIFFLGSRDKSWSASLWTLSFIMMLPAPLMTMAATYLPPEAAEELGVSSIALKKNKTGRDGKETSGDRHLQVFNKGPINLVDPRNTSFAKAAFVVNLVAVLLQTGGMIYLIAVWATHSAPIHDDNTIAVFQLILSVAAIIVYAAEAWLMRSLSLLYRRIKTGNFEVE